MCCSGAGVDLPARLGEEEEPVIIAGESAMDTQRGRLQTAPSSEMGSGLHGKLITRLSHHPIHLYLTQRTRIVAPSLPPPPLAPHPSTCMPVAQCSPAVELGGTDMQRPDGSQVTGQSQAQQKWWVQQHRTGLVGGQGSVYGYRHWRRSL